MVTVIPSQEQRLLRGWAIDELIPEDEIHPVLIIDFVQRLIGGTDLDHVMIDWH